MTLQSNSNSKPLGRPRSFDEEKALDQAMKVFWEKGFQGASINDLTQAMGLKPASVYAAFGNKHQLFTKALERYRLQQLPFTQNALQEPTAFAVAKRLLYDSAVFLTRPNFPRSCMTIQTVTAPDDCTDIQDELILQRKDAEKALRRRFARAKREGDLPPEANAASLARFITAVCQGMNIQSLNGATRKELLDLADTSLRAWPANRRNAIPGA